ncbi:LVIVD repeat-containing protein [Bacteroidota bacterium]
MKKLILVSFYILSIISISEAQYIYPISGYSSELKDVELSNFDINDTVLYLPLGIHGLHILNIKDINNITELSVFTEYEKRSRKKVYGIAHCIKFNANKAFLSYGPLGLKILDVSDPTMPFVLGTYYRYQDVYCTEIYNNYALLGYIGMGMEIVDFSDFNDIKIVSRNNERDFSVRNIQVIPPYVVISGGERGLRTYMFHEPFTSFKQAEFPKKYLTDNKSNKIEIRGNTGYLAHDSKGLTILNVGLPLYPLKVDNIKTEGKATELLIYGNYLYVAGEEYIEIFDITDAEKPEKIFEYEDKGKEFVSLKLNDNQLFALYKEGSKNYGFVIFQVE